MKFREFKLVAHRGKEEKIKTSSWLYRFERNLSAYLSWGLIKFFPNILPNHISVANIFIIFIVLVTNIFVHESNAQTIIFWQIFILFLTSIIDKVDGEVARLKKHFTQAGIFYDRAYHFFYPFGFLVSSRRSNTASCGACALIQSTSSNVVVNAPILFATSSPLTWLRVWPHRANHAWALQALVGASRL